jgi:hypothetical protein
MSKHAGANVMIFNFFPKKWRKVGNLHRLKMQPSEQKKIITSVFTKPGTDVVIFRGKISGKIWRFFKYCYFFKK